MCDRVHVLIKSTIAVWLEMVPIKAFPTFSSTWFKGSQESGGERDWGRGYPSSYAAGGCGTSILNTGVFIYMMILWWCFCTLSPHTCTLQTCTITVSRALRQKSKKSLVKPVSRALPLPQPLEGTHHHEEEKSLLLLLCHLWKEGGGEAMVEGHKLPHPPWCTSWLRWDSPEPRSMWQWISEYKIHHCKLINTQRRLRLKSGTCK